MGCGGGEAVSQKLEKYLLFCYFTYIVSFNSGILHKLFGLSNKSFITPNLVELCLLLCWVIVRILTLIIATFIEIFPSSRCCKHFICIISFVPHNHPMRYCLSFYR